MCVCLNMCIMMTDMFKMAERVMRKFLSSAFIIHCMNQKENGNKEVNSI